VQDFVFGVVDGLFTKNPTLAYIKWDCNAVVYNAYSAHLGNQQSQFYIKYVQGLYNVLERIRKKYPTVPMMLCSGGGGRVDYAALQYFTEFWPSDNTDPLERIFMQWEYSYFYPAISSSNHVTDWGKQSIKFRTDVAMMGKLGFDIVVSEFSEAIWHGDQYRLQSPWGNDFASVMYVNAAKNNAIMFNYLVSNRYQAGSHLPIKMKGLQEDKLYEVSETNLMPGHNAGIATATYSGKYLMTVGLNPEVRDGRNSVVIAVRGK
jgi:alpha-galactosidase